MKKRNQKKILIIVGVFAFLIGILIPNILWKKGYKQQGLEAYHILSDVIAEKIISFDYFFYILKIRFFVFFLCFFSALSFWGIFVVFAFMGYIGFEAGAVFTIFILQFGIKGGIAALSTLIPQYIIYLPLLVDFFDEVFGMSIKIWKNQGILPQNISAYCKKSSIYFTGNLLVIILESMVNPIILEKILKNINFF